jgi:hypothetical protein
MIKEKQQQVAPAGYHGTLLLGNARLPTRKQSECQNAYGDENAYPRMRSRGTSGQNAQQASG